MMRDINEVKAKAENRRYIYRSIVLSDKERNRVIEYRYNEDKHVLRSYAEVLRVLNINEKTVRSIVKRYDERGFVERKSNPPKPKKLTEEQLKSLCSREKLEEMASMNLS